MKFCELKMRLIAPLVVMCCLIGAGSQVAQAQIYFNDATLSNFTTPISSYATLSNFNAGDVAGPTFTPTTAGLAANGFRVYINGAGTPITGLPAGNWILATFPGAVSTIVVFPNIDHFGSAFDGYQYSIQGSNDGVTWTALFDALTVTGAGEPFTLGTSTGTRPLFVNNVLTPSAVNPSGTIGYEAFFDFGAAYKYYAFGTSTVAGPVNAEQELSAVGTGPAAITLPLLGNGADNSFAFSFATYHVIYPLDVSIAANTTMTVSPNVLAQTDCNSAINVFPAGDTPTCTTYSNTSPSNDSVIFDVACSVSGAASTSAQCPTTTGFNPFSSTGFHGPEDILNDIVYSSTDNLTGKGPQMLTAPEGSNAWVAYGVGFTDCLNCGRGGGGSSYNSTVVLADFPSATSAFAIPAYPFVGFNSPLGNPPTVNVTQAGSTVPIKFCVNYPVASSLGYNGGPYTNLSFPPLGYLSIVANPSNTSTTNPALDNTIPIDTQTNAGLLNLGGGCYNFGWKTSKALKGQAFTVTVNVGDGVAHSFLIQF